MLNVPDVLEIDQIDEAGWSVMEQLARSLRIEVTTVQATLDAIAEHAIEAVEPADHAGVILVLKGALVPQATVGTPPRIMDEFQYDHGEGPCLEAAATQLPVRIDDTAVDTRWPRLMELARSLGVASMICVPLRVGEHKLGALSLYGEVAGGFSNQHVRLARLYATHAALALAEARRTENLTLALENRDVIGQAKGILMERHRLTPDAAFARLASASQASNLKLVAVSQYLVDTGELPIAAPH